MRGVILALIFGTMYLQISKDQKGTRDRVAVLFGSCIYANLTAFGYLHSVFATRTLFYRERAEGMYNTFAFAASLILTELPILLIGAVSFVTPFYFLVGLQYNAGVYFFFLLAYFGITIVNVACSETLAIWCSKVEVAGLIFSSVFAFFFAMAGFIITRHDIPPWLIWGYWISFMRYLLEAIVINEVDGMTFYCKPDQFVTIDVPLSNGSTAPKSYCTITSGKDILQEYGMYKELIWPDVAVLYGYYLLFIILASLGLKFAKHQKR